MRAALVVAIVAALAWAAPANAQSTDSTRLTLSGFTGAFPTPSAADLDAGVLAASTPLTFTITNIAKKKTQTATVYVAASSATLGGTKPSSDLQWMLSGGATWTGLTTTNALVGTWAIPQTIGSSISFAINLQMLVRWTDAPGTYAGTNLVVTMTVP